jgi:hypothetical protein
VVRCRVGLSPVGRIAISAALRNDSVLRRTMPFAWFTSAALLAACLGGCASVSDKMSQAAGSLPGIGLPANTPERPAEAHAFPAVHDMPPQRTTAVLTADEQRAMERELVSVRDGQKVTAKPAEPAPTPSPAAKPAAKPAVAARARPAPRPEPAASMPAQPSSNRMIY